MFGHESHQISLFQLEAKEKDLREMLELRDRKTQTDELEYFVTPFLDSWFLAFDPNTGHPPC